ncbi:hypothetical protein LA02_1527 [Francisella philomiragia]|uniref:type VI secretion system baseplate subunit TssK n=1 Tax=Francisella philomiragia TaxID=28110 RepID=UPI0005A5803B|nr:type VI secretion system baseplate subunit TssK [Francisella philomiragia]AJI56667.1 hypothetical protein LA02_1527 [Francisella philomiragia]
MGQVHWSMGQVLLPDHFSLQQKHIHQLNGYVSSFIYGYDNGVLDLDVDKKILSNNILKLISLAILMPDKTFISLDLNAFCHAYEIDPKNTIDGKLSIYLNLKNEPHIELEKIDNIDIETEYYDFFISETFMSNTKLSIKIFELTYSEENSQWEIGEYVPQCILLPKIFADVFLKEITQKISEIKNKLQTLCVNKSIYDKYLFIYLRISDIELWLNQVNFSNRSVDIKVMQANVHYLYQVASIVWSNKTNFYESNLQPLDDCRNLLSLIDGQSKKEKEALHMHNLSFKQGLYQSGILEDSFFTSESRYLVYKYISYGKPVEQLLTKVFAPSKASETLLKALPGVKIKPVCLQKKKDDFPEADDVFEIIAEGSQWQSILEDRTICVRSNLSKQTVKDLFLTWF